MRTQILVFSCRPSVSNSPAATSSTFGSYGPVAVRECAELVGRVRFRFALIGVRIDLYKGPRSHVAVHIEDTCALLPLIVMLGPKFPKPTKYCSCNQILKMLTIP